MCPGDTHTRSANNRRALSLCGAWYYKHQNGPQPYINAALHLRGPFLPLPVVPLVLVFSCRSPSHPFGQLRTFLAFSSRQNVSRQNIHKTGPFRTIRGPRFQAVSASSGPAFPFAPSSHLSLFPFRSFPFKRAPGAPVGWSARLCLILK